jgi:hypothetical protein
MGIPRGRSLLDHSQLVLVEDRIPGGDHLFQDIMHVFLATILVPKHKQLSTGPARPPPSARRSYRLANRLLMWKQTDKSPFREVTINYFKRS